MGIQPLLLSVTLPAHGLELPYPSEPCTKLLLFQWVTISQVFCYSNRKQSKEAPGYPSSKETPEHFLIQFISIYKVSRAMIGMLRKGQIFSFWPVWTDQNIKCLFFFYPKWVETWAFKDICLYLNKCFSSLYKPFILPIRLNPIGSKYTLSKTQHTIFLDDLARGPQGQEAKDQASSCCCSMLVPISAHSWRGQKAKWAILSTLQHLLSILYV